MESAELAFGDSYVRVPPTAPHEGGATLLEYHGEPSSTAIRLWPCAQALASTLFEFREEHVRGLRVLELGAGLGLCGLAAWVSGAAYVLMTDLPENVPRLQTVLALNEEPDAVEVAPLDWTQPIPAHIAERRWDIIVAADIIYWPHLFEPLLSTVSILLQCGRDSSASTPDRCRVLICTCDRLHRVEEFETLARRKGWTVIVRPLPSRVVHVPCEPSPWAPNQAPAPPGVRLLELLAPAR